MCDNSFSFGTSHVGWGRHFPSMPCPSRGGCGRGCGRGGHGGGGRGGGSWSTSTSTSTTVGGSTSVTTVIGGGLTPPVFGISLPDWETCFPGGCGDGKIPGNVVDNIVTAVEDAKSEEEKAMLKVVEVDWNIKENTKNHHTSDYELTRVHYDVNNKQADPRLVIRRGEPFDITITFDRSFSRSKDDIQLVFDVAGAPNPRESRGTRVSLLLSDKDLPKEWGAKLVSQEGNKATFRIFTPPNLMVAKWLFKFDTVAKSGDASKTFRYTCPEPFFVICNPWCPDDTVFMEDPASRNEFVLNDNGRVYRGTQKQISAKPWNFGQFEDFVLETAMYLLDESVMSYKMRGDPIQLVRKLSAMTNAPDDSGVLVGNWSGNYRGGKSPLFWVGSVKILEEFWKTKKPVNFGQCWVFSAVLTTLCRTIGIPCRSVTNFASAHDTDGSITIDSHWTPEGKPLEALNDDTVWNFHVWNDAWMARPDLPSGFGGWQAIDSTPQETSDGVFQCGPASVEALKNGLINLLYDAPFVFAEVNADRVNWIQKPDGGWANTKQVSSIGKFLSTKAVGSDDRLDVTACYKFAEGSQQERTAVWRAVQESGSHNKEIYEASATDMVFDLVEKDDAIYGEDFDVKMTIHNKSTEDRTVKVTLTATVIYYTGVPVRTLKSEDYSVKCPKGAAGEVKMGVTVDEYIGKLVDMCNIKISCMAQVVETKQYHCESDDFRLRKPDLLVKAPQEIKVDEEYQVEASFTNPLPRALTQCVFQIEGANLQRPITFKHDTVPPKGEAKVSAKLKAHLAGDREIVCSFDSKELSDVDGSAKMKVLPNEGSRTKLN